MLSRMRRTWSFSCIVMFIFSGMPALLWAQSGELVWEDRFDLTGGFDEAEDVAVQGSRLFVVGRGQVPSVNGIENFNWIVRAYDRLSGTLVWQDIPEGSLYDSASAIAVHGVYLIAVGTAGGPPRDEYWVRSYNSRTGRLLWEDRVAGPSDFETASSVAIKGRMAFVVGTRLKAYDLKTGTVLWEDPMASGSAVTVNGKRVFIAGSRDGDFLVRAYDAVNGTMLWEDLSDLSGSEDRAVSLQTQGNRLIAVGSAGNFPNRDWAIRAYNPKTGVLVWEDRVDSGESDSARELAIDSRQVYVVGGFRQGTSRSDFAVRTYDRITGVLRWDDTFDYADGNDDAWTVFVNGGYVFAGGVVRDAPWRETGFLVRAYRAEDGELAWMDLQIEPDTPSGIRAITAHGEHVYAAGVGYYLDLLVRAYREASSISGPEIDIKPFGKPDKSNRVKLPPPMQRVKVEILSTNIASGESVDFDALQVDPTTVQFGPNGASPILRNVQVVDKDRDGDKDLFMKFNAYATGISCTDTETTLTGKTYAGEPFVGSDSITPYPCP